MHASLDDPLLSRIRAWRAAPRLKLPLALALACAAAASPAQESKPRYSPASKAFYCDLPVGWSAFEEDEPWGFAVHILGPDGPLSDYRAGIDVRYFEKGQPGYAPAKDAIDDLRRGDPQTGRSASPVRLMRVSGALARIFEVTETRRLPFDGLPGAEQELHHYFAILPSGDNYYAISLSSTRGVYLDYRELFVDFLRGFKAAGGA